MSIFASHTHALPHLLKLLKLVTTTPHCCTDGLMTAQLQCSHDFVCPPQYQALTQLLKLLELVTKEPLLPLMAASQQEAVCTLTRACLVVMEHNLAIYDRLVGQNVLCIVYCM